MKFFWTHTDQGREFRLGQLVRGVIKGHLRPDILLITNDDRKQYRKLDHLAKKKCWDWFMGQVIWALDKNAVIYIQYGNYGYRWFPHRNFEGVCSSARVPFPEEEGAKRRTDEHVGDPN